MQKYEEADSLNEATYQPNLGASSEPEEGAFCDTTRRIMIISPRPASLHSLVLELTGRCYDVMLFHHADDSALSLLQGDLLLIDQTRESAVGIDKLPALHSRSMPILTLLSSSADLTAVEGDYIVWPTTIQSLVDRIEGYAAPALLKPAASAAGRAEQLSHKDVLMDVKRMTVTQLSKRIELTKTEFDLLKILLEADCGVLTRQEMMDLVWGDQYFGGSNTIDAHIKSLRHKLGDDPKHPRYITTVRGVGYRLAD
jgi:two-component system alkaline phosphatase synthesis response regulator PhoP